MEMCQADKGSCMRKIPGFFKLFDKGGICCPPGDPCYSGKDQDGPPSKCTKACANIVSPFIHSCGETLIKVLQSGQDDDHHDGDTVKDVREFSAMCFKAQHDIEGKGGMAADGTCKLGGFCNFDDGSSGTCESCLPTTSACYKDGLPAKGARECEATCFKRQRPNKYSSASSGGCGGKCSANQCLYHSRCIKNVDESTCGSHKGTWCGDGH